MGLVIENQSYLNIVFIYQSCYSINTMCHDLLAFHIHQSTKYIYITQKFLGICQQIPVVAAFANKLFSEPHPKHPLASGIFDFCPDLIGHHLNGLNSFQHYVRFTFMMVVVPSMLFHNTQSWKLVSNVKDDENIQ